MGIMLKNDFYNNQPANQSIARNDLFDILKGFAVIFVIMGHCMIWGSGENTTSYDLYDNLLYKLIYSIHVPIFMIVSGYFFFITTTKNDLLGLIKKNFSGLFVPLLIWSTIGFLIIDVIGSDDLSTLTFNDYWNEFSGILWYLWAMIYCTVVVEIGCKIFKDNIFFYALVLCLGLVTEDFGVTGLCKFMLPFFLAGYFICKNRNTDFGKLIAKKKHYLLILTIPLYIGLMSLYTIDTSPYFTDTCLFGGFLSPEMQLGQDILRVTVGMCGIFNFSFIVKAFYNLVPNFFKFFIYLGKRALPFYIMAGSLNFIAQKISAWAGVETIHYGYMLLSVIVIILVTIPVYELIAKIKPLKKLLFGGR